MQCSSEPPAPCSTPSSRRPLCCWVPPPTPPHPPLGPISLQPPGQDSAESVEASYPEVVVLGPGGESAPSHASPTPSRTSTDHTFGHQQLAPCIPPLPLASFSSTCINSHLCLLQSLSSYQLSLTTFPSWIPAMLSPCWLYLPLPDGAAIRVTGVVLHSVTSRCLL